MTKPNTSMSEAELATLKEMASYTIYRFRVATCRKLVAKGFAQPYEYNDHFHRITKEGEKYLKGIRA